MSVFNEYAHYYDCLYMDKNYDAETQYISNLISKWTDDARTILDLGCGTGKHALLLAQTGKSVHGVDQSEEMIKIALNRKKHTILGDHHQLEFTCSDIQKLNFNKTFDVITSLFHVMNYQVTVDEFVAALRVIKSHLKPRGIFIFDSWYGPAVEMVEPELRVKRFEDNTKKIIRIAEPTFDKHSQRVDVNYQMLVLNKVDGHFKEFSECHQLRYLFLQDIKDMLYDVGFIIKFCEGWMTGEPPSKDTWSITIVAQLETATR